MLRRLKAVIINQGGESNEIPFHDPHPKAPLRVVQEGGDINREKWLRLADVALANDPHPSEEDAA
jgi:hypothetical protein